MLDPDLNLDKSFFTGGGQCQLDPTTVEVIGAFEFGENGEIGMDLLSVYETSARLKERHRLVTSVSNQCFRGASTCPTLPRSLTLFKRALYCPLRGHAFFDSA